MFKLFEKDRALTFITRCTKENSEGDGPKKVEKHRHGCKHYCLCIHAKKLNDTIAKVCCRV